MAFLKYFVLSNSESWVLKLIDISEQKNIKKKDLEIKVDSIQLKTSALELQFDPRTLCLVANTLTKGQNEAKSHFNFTLIKFNVKDFLIFYISFKA